MEYSDLAAQKEAAQLYMARFDAYVQAALTGLNANPAYNEPQNQKYMQSKGLTLELLAVESAAEAMNNANNFLTGKDLAPKPDPSKPTIVT